MAAKKIAPGRATISMKLRTSTISIDLTGAGLPEKTALLAYRFTVGTNSRAERDVLIERARQQEAVDPMGFLTDKKGEGKSKEDDDKLVDMQLSYAAGCYIRSAQLAGHQDISCAPPSWSFAPETYKPKDQRSDLVRAAALLIAEIERIDRFSEVIKKANAS